MPFQETDLPQQIEKEKENVEKLKAELRKYGGGKKKIGDRKKICEKNPTVLSPEDVEKIGGDLKERSSRTRRMETLDACELIHGGNQPAVDGMWLTFINSIKQKELKQYLDNSTKVKKVLPLLVNKSIYSYEKEEKNYMRSISLLYTGGILSKEKYKHVRNALAFEQSCKSKRKRLKLDHGIISPAVVTYDKLINYINSINIGAVKNFNEAFAVNNDEEDNNFGGAFREIGELLVLLAELYFFLNDVMGVIELSWFDEPNTFHVAIGADGAPFSKHDEATAWLISLINMGKHVASSYNNFLLCGANCSESHPSMSKYCRHLIHNIAYIESNTFSVDNKEMKFKFSLVPSDMKWLASFSGEITNSGYYFSSFADVCQADKSTLNGSLGTSDRCTWKPWDYAKRIENAKAIEKFKTTPVKGKLPNRNKVLDHMKTKLKCRQEFKPELGRLVDKAYAEPLHNSNNAWQQFNLPLVEDALERSNLPKHIKYSEIPADCVFKKYMNTLRNVVRANRVFKKIRKWFNEGRNGTCTYRFTGKDTKLFCHKFMHLVQALSFDGQTPCQNMFVHVHAYVGVQLREATSLFCRIEPPEGYMQHLTLYAHRAAREAFSESALAPPSRCRGFSPVLSLQQNLEAF